MRRIRRALIVLVIVLWLFVAIPAAAVSTGTVSVYHADLKDGKATFTTYVTPDGRPRQHVRTSNTPDVRFQHGDRVQTTKTKGKNARWTISPLMHRSGSKALVSGNHRLAVILVGFSDSTLPAWFTAAQMRQSVFDYPLSVAAWFTENSYGLLSLSGEVYGPYTIPISRQGCPYSNARYHGQQAVTAQYGASKLTEYQHFLYIFPGDAGCPWGGLSTLGGNPSHAWSAGLGGDVIRHELGHSLGLWHSHSKICVNASVGPPAVCLDVEYGDLFDVMGRGAGQPFNGAQKSLLGWLTAQTVTTGGIYPLQPYETVGSALRVPTPSGDTYWVERRTEGLFVRLERGGSNGIYLLDMTPIQPDWGRPWLPVGGSFTVPGLTLTAITDSTVQVAVAGVIIPPPPPPGGTVAITGHTAIGREMTFRGTLVGSTSLTAIADTTGIAPKYIVVDKARKTWTVRVTGLFKGLHTFTVNSGDQTASITFTVLK